MIEELDTEEMRRDPKINKHLQIVMKRLTNFLQGIETAIDEDGKYPLHRKTL